MIRFFSVTVTFILILCGHISATPIQWASTVESSNFPDPEGALGKPDNVTADWNFDWNGSTIEFATYSGFGNGDKDDYTGLASFLGVGDDVLSQADIISFEFNGAGGGILETSTWIFENGIQSLTVEHDIYNPLTGGPILALGTISTAEYASYFNLTPRSDTYGQCWAFVLFDIDKIVDPFNDNFRVTMQAIGSGGPDNPELDAIGRIGSPVPEPGTIVMLGIGLSFLLFGKKRRHLIK